jgi:CheY-like chemotaxis protein
MEPGPHPGKVMVVDDNPANLKLLEDMLRQHGYEVRSFPRGRLALAAAEQEPPDLILLDINMPEMNGYEVCEQLKSSGRLSGIPVIFLSALNAIEDKIQGFRSGGVDYISKPFQFEEVEARVQTHSQLRRAQEAEHDLLEKTLGGAVGTLWELVQLTSPGLALRSQAIRDIVRRIARILGVKDSWQYELAATLCLVGCLALPEDVFERGYRGEALSAEEGAMFRAHPETAARLLLKIPRLEIVAEIIRGQQQPKNERPDAEEFKAESCAKASSGQGARILNLALEFDRRVYRAVTFDSALVELRMSRRFDPRMLDALEGYSPAPAEFEVRRIPVRSLRPGMVLEKDVMSAAGGVLILKAGTVLTDTWIQRLDNFSKTRGVDHSIGVRIPKLAAMSSMQEELPLAEAKNR